MKRSHRIQWLAIIAVFAVTVTLAVIHPGFKAQEMTPESASLWVTRQSGQYARVNTLTAEIDTVRQVESPSGVLQTAGAGVLLAQGLSQAWVLDQAQPVDLQLTDEPMSDAESAASAQQAYSTPEGTRVVTGAAGRVLYLTDSGEVFLTASDSDGFDTTTPVDAFAGEPVTAIASTASGMALLFSETSGQLRWFNATTEKFASQTTTVSGWLEHREKHGELIESGEPTAVQLSIIGDDWVIYDSATTTVWRESRPPVGLDPQGRAILQASTQGTTGVSPGSHAAAVLISDENGLWQVGADEAVRVAEAMGSPAQPLVTGSTTPQPAAAWMTPNSVMLWVGGEQITNLPIDSNGEGLTDPLPVMHSNGEHAVLADERTGMMWTIPDGTLIPVSQWALSDPPQQEISDTVSQEATDPEPPTAAPDAFGVRAGAPALLPVLLNDFDPNARDVLTIVTEGIGDELSPDFGVVAALPHAQALQIHTSATATGTTQFQYRVTDGVHLSEPTTVTLEVVPEEQNTAPEWCGVTGCQRDWPNVTIVPGATLLMPMLEGWVDPQGDPLVLAAAQITDRDAPVQAFVTEAGELALRHNDPNAPASDHQVTVTVADSKGDVAQRELELRVRPGAAPVMTAAAVTVQVGQTVELTPLHHVTGGSGSFELISAVTDHGSAQTTVHPNTQTVGVSAPEPGGSTLVVTVRDRVTEQEIQGVVRVTASETPPTFTMPAMSTFVRAQSDTTLDVLSALPAADARGITLESAFVRDGAVQVELIEHAKLRVASAGSASDLNKSAQSPFARLGTIDVSARSSVEQQTATGQITVYEVSESEAGGVIAVADAVTVRAGALTEIPVLKNDIAAAAEQLVLHPEIRGSGAPGELAFASGSQLRYLAPDTPGEYTLSYTVSGASTPEQAHNAQVRVTVTGHDGNRPPHAPTISARIDSGARTEVVVPLSGGDPDGDRVRLVRVSADGGEGLTATIGAAGDRIDVTASETILPGIQELRYTVRDATGADGTGVLRVIVTATQSERGSPIAYADEVRISAGHGEPVTVTPTSNDIDPAGGELELVSVEPNLPGGSAHPEYAAQLALLDTSSLADGVLRVRGADSLGTSSYRYTVRSSASTGTATGLMNVRVSARVGSVAPVISDTVLTAGQRDELISGGVDVLTQRVIWPGGDTSSLELSLWGDTSHAYQAEGSRISGPYPTGGDTIPFAVTGKDAQGTEIESYGFLFIPAIDELRITRMPGAEAVSVDEEATASVNMRTLVAVGARDTIEVAAEQFPVHRSQASCAGTNTSNGASLSYQAGREAPWVDYCTVKVKLAEQTTYSTVAIPITVVPNEPAAQLSSVTRTIAPGATETIDLTDMLSWYGNRAGKSAALKWSFDSTASGFDITRSGTTLTVTPLATSTPGTQHAIPVAVTGAGTAKAVLTLRVGTAAPDTPTGATIGLRCTVGASCAVEAVGQPGEYDPFANRPGGGLTLASVDGSACTVANFSVSGNRIQVAWPDDRGSGGMCTVSFTVRDAQQRSGTGRIEFDAQGIPQPPASLAQSGYTADSVQLFVTTGVAAQAYPALTGIVIDQDGVRVASKCAPSNGGYICTVSGLTPGEKHRFHARAVNSVGESDATTNAVTAWAYRTPDQPTVEVAQVSAESTAQATVEITVQNSDRTTGGYRVTVGGQSQVFRSADRMQLSGVAVGQVNWEVVPLSELAVPPGDTADGARAFGTLTVGGLPILSMQLATDSGSDTVRATIAIDPNGANATRYGHSSNTDQAALECSITTSGTQTTIQLNGVRNRSLHVIACAENEWGAAQPLSQHILVGGELPAPNVHSGFTVSTEPARAANGSYEYMLRHTPQVSAEPGTRLEYRVNGMTVGERFPETLSAESRPSIQVRQVGEESVSPWAEILGNVPTVVQITPPVCVPETATNEELRATISTAARTSANIEYTGGQLRITWSGEYASLLPLTITANSCGQAASDPPG